MYFDLQHILLYTIAYFSGFLLPVALCIYYIPSQSNKSTGNLDMCKICVNTHTHTHTLSLSLTSLFRASYYLFLRRYARMRIFSCENFPPFSIFVSSFLSTLKLIVAGIASFPNRLSDGNTSRLSREIRPDIESLPL